VEALILVIVLLAIAGVTALGRSMKVVQQYEKGVLYRFGRVQPEVVQPGLAFIRPIGDRMQKVNMQIVAMTVPAQDGITRDNVSVRVDAVVYFRVVDPIKATINVQNYMSAISQQAQTSLRSIIGQSEMDQLLAERDTVNRELRRIIDEPTEEPWGVRVERVEIKDVSLPEGMKRSMSRQAEAERERRARIITAGGAPVAAAADRGRGGGREEQHAGHAGPRRAAAVLREDGARAARADGFDRPGRRGGPRPGRRRGGGRGSGHLAHCRAADRGPARVQPGGGAARARGSRGA
jgi:regulator of protease activity HflC (stomatin/prohibitin superfamily)